MAGVKEEQVLEKMFEAMETWSREKMRVWVEEVLGEDESMKPFIEQLFEQKDLTGYRLAEIFKEVIILGAKSHNLGNGCRSPETSSFKVCNASDSELQCWGNKQGMEIGKFAQRDIKIQSEVRPIRTLVRSLNERGATTVETIKSIEEATDDCVWDHGSKSTYRKLIAFPIESGKNSAKQTKIEGGDLANPEVPYQDLNFQIASNLLQPTTTNFFQEASHFVGRETLVPPRIRTNEEKCQEWFECNKFSTLYQKSPSIPEHGEEELQNLIKEDDGESLQLSCSTEGSNDEGNGLQDTHITSTSTVRDPDLATEYCGAGLLKCQLRVKAGEDDDCFLNLFSVPSGCNYDKHNFKAKCNLCEELLTSRTQLSDHIKSAGHRSNLTKTSLKLIGNKSKPDFMDKLLIPSSDLYSRKTSLSMSESTEGKNNTGDDKISQRKKSKCRSPNGCQTKSHSRCGRQRSGSRSSLSQRRRKSELFSYGLKKYTCPSSPPRIRRSRSRSQIKEIFDVGKKTAGNKSPPRQSPIGEATAEENGDIFREKLTLQATGKWTNELEFRWNLWEREEQTVKKIFGQMRKDLQAKPDQHHKYIEERQTFVKMWEKGLAMLGKDASSQNYDREWKNYWEKLSDAFLNEDLDSELRKLRKKYGMDLKALKELSAKTGAPVFPAAPNMWYTQFSSPAGIGFPPPSLDASRELILPVHPILFTCPPPTFAAGVPPPGMVAFQSSVPGGLNLHFH